MTNPEVAAAVVFGTWFALTVLVQLPMTWCRLPRRFEPTGHLLPGWHFFSPKPIVADIDLLYRYVRGDDPGAPPTEWMEVLPYSTNPLKRVLINPQRRVRKALFQCGQTILLAQQAPPEQRYAVTLSIPYLLLLDRVTALSPGAAAVQFRIDVVRHGPFPVLRGFQSPMHAVELSGDFELAAEEVSTS